MAYKAYLVHGRNNGGGNPNHDPKTGQFTFAKGAKAASDAGKTLSSLQPVADKMAKGEKGPRKDLSDMSDDELRKVLNRERMEREYDMYFNQPVENKGWKFVSDLLPILVGAATVTAAGLSVAGTIKGWVDSSKASKASNAKLGLENRSLFDNNESSLFGPVDWSTIGDNSYSSPYSDSDYLRNKNYGF